VAARRVSQSLLEPITTPTVALLKASSSWIEQLEL
jgi:hypothetical protein